MNYKKLVMAGVGVFALLLSIGGPFIATAHVSAAGGFSWVDAQTVEDDQGNIYVFKKTVGIGGTISRVGGSYGAVFIETSHPDVNCTVNTQSSPQTETLSNNKYQFKNSDLNYGGASAIIINLGAGVNAQKWQPTGSYANGTNPVASTPTVFISFENPVDAQGGDSGCQTDPYQDISIANGGNATILFNWFDNKTIVSLPARGSVNYKNNDTANPTHFVAATASSGTCHDYIVASAGAGNGEYFKASPNKSTGSSCSYKDTGPVELGSTSNAANAGTEPQV